MVRVSLTSHQVWYVQFNNSEAAYFDSIDHMPAALRDSMRLLIVVDTGVAIPGIGRRIADDAFWLDANSDNLTTATYMIIEDYIKHNSTERETDRLLLSDARQKAIAYAAEVRERNNAGYCMACKRETVLRRVLNILEGWEKSNLK